METKRVARPKHSAQFRAEVLQACRQADASVAAIALRNRLNTNVVYRLLREDGLCLDAGAGIQTAVSTRPGAEFIAVQFSAAAVAAASTDIRIEVRRGASSVTVNWPLQTSSECAAWLREWLR
jgi:transposase